MKSKIVLYLMNKKGYSVLKALLDNKFTNYIEYIVGAKDENVQKDYFKDIKELCLYNDIEFYERTIDEIPKFDGYKIAIGWRWIISDSVKLIVFHDSLLPKYRGFAPLVNMLINGEKEIGVTSLFAEKSYDTGDIIHQISKKITYPIKIEEAIDEVSGLYDKLAIKISDEIVNDHKLPRRKQEEDKASYSLWRDYDDYFIDWNNSSEKIKRKVDAVGFPYKGAKAFLNDKEITINSCETVSDLNIENRDIGKVIFKEEDRPVVVCGKGLLKIIEAQFSETNQSIFPIEKFRSRFC
ncbi:methionyl-tRNA formyltransferase [Halanaerobium congolense]|uniref:Methionyl-tRNA formyltransferase n=1 Tax=Halanaerobium congolense TaxID=54121 RepID=A0A1G6SQX7_9FIRM|nr:formyltransferase family protein [Halanaerobium congolense]SDD19249.1 methionyl-tRNA formyltransferase [Halanaerobium congolense]